MASRLMQPLESTRGSLERDWRLLEADLQLVLKAAGGGVTIHSEWQLEPVVAFLTGPAAEAVTRDRGRRTFAVPLLCRNERTYWVSWLEEWNPVPGRRYRYRSSNLTVYVGPFGEPRKTQLFRAEWPGVSDWQRDGVLGLQAPGAGHPHWQIDAVSELADVHRRRQSARDLLEFLRDDAEEFDDSLVDEIGERVGPLTAEIDWTRTHFASNAGWSKDRWSGDLGSTNQHAHCPASTREIRDWICSTLVYLRHELGHV